MSKRDVYEAKTTEFITPILEAKGFSLVDVEYVREGADNYLRAYIDKPGGININDCVAVSEEMNVILDREDYISDPYTFEVSSPDLSRPLKKDKDFERNLGNNLEIKTYKPINGSKEFEAVLDAYDADTITVHAGDESMVLNRSDLALVRIAIDF
ncbi:MAG: ribosome maturation factor RimP [Lachnospiraceae bacterium]|jgi:ribosome maturation factor RimP|nr:ribosome maturation factor RimP [Lachnospiraceae bacterium]